MLGNRNINKLRFMVELAPGDDGMDTDVYWDKKAKPSDVWLREKSLRNAKRKDNLNLIYYLF